MNIKKIIYTEFLIKNFKYLLTLAYTPECYPINEQLIKTHLNDFSSYMRKKTKETLSYFYVYELQKNNTIHIHILTQLETDKQLCALKKYWLKIIGTEQQESFNFTKVTEQSTLIYCNYILILLDNKKEREYILLKLGESSRLFGGSKDFQLLLKKLRKNNIDIPLVMEKPKNSLTLDILCKELCTKYKDTSQELIEEELSLELCNYSEAYQQIVYTDLVPFLNKSKSKLGKGYLEFFKFVQTLAKEILLDFKGEIENYTKKERKSINSKIFISIFEIYDQDIEKYELVLTCCLSFIIKAGIRNIPIQTFGYEIGKALLTTDNIIINLINKKVIENVVELDQIYYRRIGLLIFLIIKKLLKEKININIVDFNELNSDDIIDEDNFLYLDKAIELDYSEAWLNKTTTSKEITLKNISEIIKLTYPMLLPPKDWVIIDQNNNKIKNTTIYYDTVKITTGGYLLNGYYFKKSLQKLKNNEHQHKLGITDSCLKTINKIQKTAYVVNIDQLDWLTENLKYIEDYLPNKKKQELIKYKTQLLAKKKNIYIEKNILVKSNSNLEPINIQIKNLNYEIEKISSQLSKNELLLRTLNGFNSLKDKDAFYYSYECDFRMRIYPQQMELSPQGSKLARSLIKFKETFKFNLDEFIFYITRLYQKIYNFNENLLITIYTNKIEPIILKFINNDIPTIKKIFEEAAEPYLFIAACLEYKKFKQAESKNENYYTGFPLILDCSGSGPQILSLLFLLDDFSTYLNLEPNIQRCDFYISIISAFLKNNQIIKQSIKEQNIDESLLVILRDCCKQIIMTQLYGVSYRKTSRTLEINLIKEKDKLVQYLIENIDYDKFINNFINEFWNYLRELPLFKLREFFQRIIKDLSKVDQELSWSILNMSYISVNYQKQNIKKLDFKTTVLGRLQYTLKQGSGIKNFNKMRTSAQANFIHSIDAAINISILEKYNSSIFPIHDAWGVGMNHGEHLKKEVKDMYYNIAKENIVLRELIKEFIELISKSVSIEAGLNFKLYCENKMQTGNYDPNKLMSCKYMVYYGS